MRWVVEVVFAVLAWWVLSVTAFAVLAIAYSRVKPAGLRRSRITPSNIYPIQHKGVKHEKVHSKNAQG